MGYKIVGLKKKKKMNSFFSSNLYTQPIHVVIMGCCVLKFEEQNEFNPFWNEAVT